MNKCLILYFSSFLFFSSNLFTSSYLINNNPILLFPGFGGSKLVKNNINIWPPKIKYFLLNYKEWEKDMISNEEYMILNEKVKTLSFGDKKSLDLDSNILYLVRKNFYNNILSEYKDIFPIPYDFRLVHLENYRIKFYKELEEYIESFNKPVILLTHSCGGLLCHNFILSKSHQWRNKHVKSIINVNVPFGGLIASLQECIMDTKTNSIIGKNVIRNLGGVIINLPNNKYIDNILTVDGKKIDNYLNYFKLDQIKVMYDQNKNLIDSFSKPNDVKTHIVFTSKVQTPESINIINNKININYGDGDGIVPISSILVPKIWNNKEIIFNDLPNYEHSSILFSKKIKEIINSC